MSDITALFAAADDLADRIRTAGPRQRIELQPTLGRVINQLSASGEVVPKRLRLLHEQLIDEAIEDRFDNLPI